MIITYLPCVYIIHYCLIGTSGTSPGTAGTSSRPTSSGGEYSSTDGSTGAIPKKGLVNPTYREPDYRRLLSPPSPMRRIKSKVKGLVDWPKPPPKFPRTEGATVNITDHLLRSRNNSPSGAPVTGSEASTSREGTNRYNILII